MKNNEVYVSIDIETDGGCPGVNSMLSIGNAAFDSSGNLLDTWEANLEALPDAVQDQRTMTEFWAKNPEAWAACRKDTRPAATVMQDYVNWLKKLEKQNKRKVVAVCAPAGFDFTFVYWYLMKFVGHSPFSFSCIDMKTYAMALLDLPYRECGKKSYPKEWFDVNASHSHIAVEDAIEQGRIFMNMLKYNDSLIKKIC